MGGAFSDLLLTIFVPQNIPESISADLKRFESICDSLTLNSRGICGLVVPLRRTAVGILFEVGK